MAPSRSPKAICDRDGIQSAFGAGPLLFLSPHDDDVVLGAGLTVAVAVAAGVEVHVAIVTDGALGYVTLEERADLVRVRAREAEAAYAALGLPTERIHWLGFPDGALVQYEGCRPPGSPPGVSQRLVQLIRQVRPTAVFACTPTDLHPDHRVLAREAEIALFWSQSKIWLELGDPIEPARAFSYAVYAPFDGSPDVIVTSDLETLRHKREALHAFASQGVIDDMVAALDEDGPLELLQTIERRPYRARDHVSLASAPAIADSAFSDDLSLAFAAAEEPPEPWPPLVEAFQGPSLLFAAEGSSLLFPTGFARDLARRVRPTLALHACGGRSAVDLVGQVAATCFLSSSGATRELNDLLDVAADPNTRRIALFANPEAPLRARLVTSRVVLPRPERAVPATASVVAFALELAVALHEAHGLEAPLTLLREAARALRETPVPASFTSAAPYLNRLIIADPDGPLGAELALKARECLGLGAQDAPGTSLLHGFEEIMGPRDLVLWFHPPQADARRIARAIGRTGATLLTLGPSDAAFPLPDAGPFSPIISLLAGYRVLEAMAYARGRDPARPERAEKVGNPIGQG